MGFVHYIIGRAIGIGLNTQFRSIGIRKQLIFTGLAKGYRKRSKTRDYLRSLGVIYSIEFCRPYMRSRSKRRI